MLIREPELGFNTQNRRTPRKGRGLSYSGSDNPQFPTSYKGFLPRRGKFYSGGPVIIPPTYSGYHDPPAIKFRKRDLESDQVSEDQLNLEAKNFVTEAKCHWIDLFNGFAEMTDLVASDLAFFLYCMLNQNLQF